MLDWSKLKPYHGDKRRSFEELCYQIAKSLFHDCFTRIDDSGGGDGVEFYMVLPNGDEWGWQAKFYYPQLRLNHSNRKSSIETSLASSCKKHPRLKKWILCTPTNLTNEERTWFNQELRRQIPNNMMVELEHWGDSEFNDWVRQPPFGGIRNYFFGDLELSMDWFKTRFSEISRIYKDKFNPNLHTPTRLDDQIKNTLGESTLARELHGILDDTCVTNEEYLKSIDGLNNPISPKIEWGTVRSSLLTALESHEVLVKAGLVTLSEICESLDQCLYDKPRSWSLDEAKDFVESVVQSDKVCDTAYSEIDISALTYTGEEKDKTRVLEEASRILREPVRLATVLADHFSYFARILSVITRSNINIIGGPGVGKTHLVSHIIDERTRSGLPALLVPGSWFRNEQPIWQQMLRLLDVPANYSWDDFLSALNSCGQAYQTRIPLVIDGLNEARANGALSEIWKNELPVLVTQVGQTKNVVLITTCRASYEKGVWPNHDLPDRLYLYGWDQENLEAAIQKYFNWYKIKGDLTTSSLHQFQNPIYLKIFCETSNAGRKHEKEVYVGEQTLFEIFEVWLDQCSQTICSRLDLHRSVSVAQDSIRKIALHLWENRVSEIPIATLAELIDSRRLQELQWDHSWTKAILDEGLLICSDMRDNGEVAYFTYDLLGGYVVARSLVEKEKDNMDQFLRSQNVTDKLFVDDLRLRHPLYEDIARSLAVVLPARTGRFLHEIREDQRSLNVSIRAIFEVPPDLVSASCVEIVRRLFGVEQNRRLFFDSAMSTMTQTRHPLNAVFWSRQLQELSMAERDTSWTEYVREKEEQLLTTVDRFEKLCMGGAALSNVTSERCHLMAHQLMWMLTSTVRTLRDRATRALYWYGRRMPDRFFDLVLSSLGINDPYVPERMLAATYGVAMARHIEFADHVFSTVTLRRYGKELYEAMFKENSSHATTHVLMRDYARLTIELALLHHPDLLDSEQQQRIRPPFLGQVVREWGQSEDKDDGKYRDGNAPIHMDFGNYTIGRLVKDRANYDDENAEYKIVLGNIFWRIYDLGYALEIFGELDKFISRWNWEFGRGRNGGKIDRYGKKYSWIAFFELAGSRQDRKLLPGHYGEPRVSDCDVDPSFPEDVQQYQVPVSDFLEISSTSLEEWIEKTTAPHTIADQVVSRILEDEGPWVLLDGIILQEDLEAGRDCFVYPRCLLVQNSDSEEFVSLLKRNPQAWIPDIPEDYYTYAGEIPWCSTFPNHGQDEMELTVETKREVRPMGMRTESGFLIKEEEVEIPSVVRNVAVFLPVRYNAYESYHSEVNPGRFVLVPAKEISEFLQLCSQPQTFDMYERNGRKASITVRWGKDYHDSKLIFLRQELFDKYLEAKDLSAVWAIWGERRLWSKEETSELRIKKYTRFFQVFRYTPKKA